jgi:hypothetical protein
VGLLDASLLGQVRDSLGQQRAGLGTDLSTSVITMGNPLLKTAGGMMLGQDAMAGKATSVGSLKRMWVTTVRDLSKVADPSLQQLAAVTALGRYASIGGGIDAIKASGFAAETYTRVYAESIGLKTFNVQRKNGTGFDLVTAKVDANGMVTNVMVLDAKNTIGSVDSITAFGAGAKRAGNYQGNVDHAIKQLVAENSRVADQVVAALENKNFGLAVVSHPGARIDPAAIAAVQARTSKTPTLWGWLP